MTCKIEGCDRYADYKAQQVCQKHYFRFMRYGTYDLSRKVHPNGSTRVYRRTTPNGYEKLYEPEHQLANSDGYVYEHRKVFFEQIDSNPDSCEMCGNPVDWSTCHIDHKDNDKSHNLKENLRCLCRACNVFRAHTSTSMGARFLTHDGKTMTAGSWSRQPGVNVCGGTITRRKQMGMSDHQALFAEKGTHKNSRPNKQPMKYDELRFGNTPQQKPSPSPLKPGKVLGITKG